MGSPSALRRQQQPGRTTSSNLWAAGVSPQVSGVSSLAVVSLCSSQPQEQQHPQEPQEQP
jgi:hypothetical protein